MTMRGISEASRHQAFVLTSRRRWDPRSIGSRPLHRLRPRHRFFRTSRSRQPLRVRSSSLDQTNDKIKDFPMVQIRWACETYTKSSQQKGAICISDLNFGPQAQPPQRKEAHSQSRRRRLQRALPGTTSRPTKAITTTKNHDARRRLLLHFALLRPQKTSLHGTRRGIVNYSKTRTPFERTKKRASGTLLTRH
jgi:hypothetical protein